MILHHFYKKENKDKIIANKIYLSAIEFIQLIINKREFKIKKDFNSSFELMTILLFSIFFASKKKSKNKHINQYLMNLYIIDLDKSLRELGIGDMSLGKYVKSYVKKFYYRVSKLENIFKTNNFKEFDKYINTIDIQNHSNNKSNLSKYLFVVANELLKKAKGMDLSKFTFINFIN